MRLFKYAFLIFIFPLATYAQVGGESVYQFLNLATSSRQVALGGEVLTLTDDVNQALWNPATINLELDGKLALNYTRFLQSVNTGSVSFAYLVDRHFGVIHGGVQYLHYGTLIEADENGVETGTFKASDIAISVGYSYNIPKTYFFIGANLKLINSSISNFSSLGISADLGFLYHNPFKPYKITIVARNLGSQISTFDGTREKVPLTIALGGEYQLEHVPLKWYFTLNNLQQWDLSAPNPSNSTSDLDGNITHEKIGFFTNALKHFVIGAELFPKSAINLRAGFNFRRAQDLKLQNARTFAGISFGFGVKMKRITFNYATSKYHSAANASTFSMLIDLEKR